MDQVKIGKFIAERRREMGLTQLQLAEKLHITDRAVSKWETGRSLPDSAIMLELCNILKITVNDLLCGEVITMDNYTKELENNLLEMVKQKEQADRRLLRMEIVTAILCLLPLLFCAIVLPHFIESGAVEEWLGALIIGLSVLPLLIATPFMIKIEQTAGYYQCQHCGHKHVPKYKAVFLALHMGTTRYLKCPNCGKKSWQKKTISKD